MVDINNLKRIKGILSARLGAEIPKFLNPAGPIQFDPNDPGFKQFILQNNLESNATVWKEYLRLKQADPKATIELLSAYYNGTATVPSLPSMDIPGADPALNNPNAAVEASAALNASTEQIQQQNAALTLALLAPIPVTLLPVAGINIPPVSEIKLPDKIELPAETKAAIDKSAGMNFELQKQKEAADKANLAQAKGQTLNGISLGLDAIGGAVGAGQAATDSNTTKTVDAAYDGIANAAANFGPWGKVVSVAMKAAGVAGDAIQSMGGGTDQQTKMDQWMDSSFFSWNIGMINGFAGKNTQDFGVDLDILASVGSSYGGTASDLNDAAEKAGKKYGLFSSKARKKADKAIADAKAKLNLMGDISDTASDQRLAVLSMGELAGLAYSMMASGGYDLKYTYAAKQGGILEWNPVETLEWQPQVKLNWELPTFKEGGNIEFFEELEWIPEFLDNKSDFNTWFNSIPKQYRTAGYDYKKAYEVFDWDLLSKHAKDPNLYHLYSVSPTPDENGNYPFLKLGKLNENPELKGEFDWYNSEAGKDHKAKFDIQYIGDRYYYVPKKFKNGGKTEESDIPEIEETTLKNVIPEGALHKNKHHMEHAEGLTKKGIPVIDEDGELQAEIEHSEIIFTLEVTKKLEEYYEIFYSESASNKEKEQAALEAGKLLVYLILENTEDRTGLIESCKKGGTLNFKKSTEDLIEEALEWIPAITIIEEVIEEVKEEEKLKKKSEKEQMKEAIKEVLIELLTK